MSRIIATVFGAGFLRPASGASVRANAGLARIIGAAAGRVSTKAIPSEQPGFAGRETRIAARATVFGAGFPRSASGVSVNAMAVLAQVVRADAERVSVKAIPSKRPGFAGRKARIAAGATVFGAGFLRPASGASVRANAGLARIIGANAMRVSVMSTPSNRPGFAGREAGIAARATAVLGTP